MEVIDITEIRRRQILEDEILEVIRNFDNLDPEELYILLEEYTNKRNLLDFIY